ncbi:uncharacterized protein [Ciconia boyciana]|uniref:uncharacterized protein n=1 Tax=Ciconia boyciana TaxID=52775 RepID=UPI003B9E63BA
MCIHIHFGGTSEIITSSAQPARRPSPPAWAPVQAEEVRSRAPQPRLPCEQSWASAVQSERARCAGSLAKSSPAQVLCHEVSSLEEESPVPGRGHGDAACLSQPVLLQRCRWASATFTSAAVGQRGGGSQPPAWKQHGVAPAAPQVLPLARMLVFAWAGVPGCLRKAGPSDGAQRDTGLSARPRRPLKPADAGQPVFLCHRPAKPRLPAPRRRLAPLPGGAAERGAIKGSVQSVIPSSLAPGPAFGLLKALLQRCQFSLIRTSKPELPNILERSRRLPKRRRGQAEGQAARGGSELGCSGQSVCRRRQRGPPGGQEGGSGPAALAREAPRERSCQGKVRDVSWTRERPFAARPPMHRVIPEQEKQILQENTKKEEKVLLRAEVRCFPTEVLSALLSPRDRVSPLCSAVAQHPSSELIRSMHF